jgi:hypothetical protein
MDEPRTAIVPKRELLSRFNSGGYQERVARGDLREDVITDNHPSAPLANEPFCTRSQLVEYLTKTGTSVAVIHRYLRTDGTLGLSGKPDPKTVLDRGVLYQAFED